MPEPVSEAFPIPFTPSHTRASLDKQEHVREALAGKRLPCEPRISSKSNKAPNDLYMCPELINLLRKVINNGT